MAEKEPPITFIQPCYVILDIEANGVLTTQFGNLAIFNTRGIAEHTARGSLRKTKVMAVMITPIQEH